MQSLEVSGAVRLIYGSLGVKRLNGTHQLLFYADDVNTLGENLHTINENAHALVVVSKDIGLEENTDKTFAMITSQDQNAGRSHSIKIDNSSSERVK